MGGVAIGGGFEGGGRGSGGLFRWFGCYEWVVVGGGGGGGEVGEKDG